MSNTLQRLLAAKGYSDRRHYPAKHSILAQLLREHPGEFKVDSSDRGIVGITHVPTNFRIHMPQTAVPAAYLGHDESEWRDVGQRARKTAADCSNHYRGLRLRCGGLPPGSYVALQPDSSEVCVGLPKRTPNKQANAIADKFPEAMVVSSDLAPNGYGVVPWILVKRAEDPVLSTVAQLARWQPSQADEVIGGPNPLQATLASGLLGAGVGYGLGTIGEQLLPERSFRRGVLRRNAALLGGGLAAVPGLMWALANYQSHPRHQGQLQAVVDSWPHGPLPPDLVPPPQGKVASEGLAGAATLPSIPVDTFGRVIWQDPNTPMSIRAATNGLLDTAAYMTGRNTLSPWDIAKITTTGAVNGLIVGKTLGALAGLKPEAQDTLQRVGIWGSLLTAVIPNAFPSAFSPTAR